MFLTPQQELELKYYMALKSQQHAQMSVQTTDMYVLPVTIVVYMFGATIKAAFMWAINNLTKYELIL